MPGLVTPRPEFVGGPAARKEGFEAMALSEQEYAKIREEVRVDFKRKNRPQLLMWAVLWAILLAVLASASTHLHF